MISKELLSGPMHDAFLIFLQIDHPRGLPSTVTKDRENMQTAISLEQLNRC